MVDIYLSIVYIVIIDETRVVRIWFEIETITKIFHLIVMTEKHLVTNKQRKHIKNEHKDTKKEIVVLLRVTVVRYSIKEINLVVVLLDLPMVIVVFIPKLPDYNTQINITLVIIVMVIFLVIIIFFDDWEIFKKKVVITEEVYENFMEKKNDFSQIEKVIVAETPLTKTKPIVVMVMKQDLVKVLVKELFLFLSIKKIVDRNKTFLLVIVINLTDIFVLIEGNFIVLDDIVFSIKIYDYITSMIDSTMN